jgi:O-antigen/teichoic acid export membrane protein
MIGGVPKALALRLGWTSTTFAIMQILRLVNSVVLARLLAPPVFGLMMIVNTIKTGVELLSDVGINQNIVSSKQGESPDFYDTAWTLQVFRGVILGLLCVAFAGVFADFFEEPQLSVILPIFALLFIFSGFQSTGRALLQKRVAVVRADLFELSLLLFTVMLQIVLAFITPTIWALVIGSVVSGAVAMIASYYLIPGLRHRFLIEPASAHQILHFSKWIFLSSIIYFLAMNFDRLYFAKQISLTDLGVFAIARSLADMISSAAVRAGNLLIFPTVAAMQGSNYELRGKLLRGRRTLLLLVALGLGVFVAISDVVVLKLYPAPFAEAATLFPMLLLGVWFAILATVNSSILLGTARPALPTWANGAKLLAYVIFVPLAFYYNGLIAAILVLNAGEVVRYLVLWMFTRRQHLAFGRDDLALTLLFVAIVVVARQLLWALGLTGGLDDLFPVLQPEFWGR